MAKKRKTSLGCLFWIALILLVLVIFLFNRNTINSVLENTNFIDIITNQDTDSPAVNRVDEENSPTDSENSVQPDNSSDNTNNEETDTETQIDTEEKDEEIPVVLEPEEKVEEDNKIEETEPEEREDETNYHIRKSRLYFVSIQDDGAIGLKAVVRPIEYISSPLTKTLEALLNGLTASELNEGLVSLIPDDTVIRRIYIENNIAYIDFNQAFTFNTFGREGYKAQLQQIVYTATEFPTVYAVQFLIEGEKKQFLGGDGVMIEKPLSRDSF